MNLRELRFRALRKHPDQEGKVDVILLSLLDEDEKTRYLTILKRKPDVKR